MASGRHETENDEADGNARRRPHSVRFLDPEWERIEAFAETRGFTGLEFVRYAALAAVAEGGEATGRLAPLIETTFRAVHILVTKMRDDMLEEGRGAEVEELVKAARALQEELLRKGSG